MLGLSISLLLSSNSSLPTLPVHSLPPTHTNKTAALVAKQLGHSVRANTVVIGRMGMAGNLHTVGDVALKLRAVAEEGKRQTEAKRKRTRLPVVMHVLISPEHLDDDNVPVEASGAPVLLPEALWTHLAFYPVADSETMLKILLHPADARGASRFEEDGGGVVGFWRGRVCSFRSISHTKNV